MLGSCEQGASPSPYFAAANSSFFAFRHPDPTGDSHAQMKEAGAIRRPLA
jgi:hypothetical protein